MIEAMSLPSLTSLTEKSSTQSCSGRCASYKRTTEKMNAEAMGELMSAYMDLWRETTGICIILDYWMSVRAEYFGYTTLSRMYGQTLQRPCT